MNVQFLLQVPQSKNNPSGRATLKTRPRRKQKAETETNEPNRAEQRRTENRDESRNVNRDEKPSQKPRQIQDEKQCEVPF